MTAARLSLAQLGSEPPYLNAVQPQILWVSGKVSRNCAKLRVRVGLAPNAAPLFEGDFEPNFPTVAPGSDPNDPQNDVAWTASFPFDPTLPPFNIVYCGMSLHVEVHSAVPGVTGAADDTLSLSCKGAPPQPGGGSTPGTPQGGNGGSGWNWPFDSPPSIMCRYFRGAYGIALTAAFFMIAWAACYPTPDNFLYAWAAIGGAGSALVVWRGWCAPTPCEKWGVVCWAAKNGVIAAIALALIAMSAGGLIAAALFGAVAAWAIAKLDQYRCPIPGLGPWPY